MNRSPYQNNELQEKMLMLKDDELRKIIYINNNEYRQEAIYEAKTELFGRNGGHIWESDCVTLIDLLKYADADEILNRILELFPNEARNIEKYQNIIGQLMATDVVIDKEMFIIIEELKDLQLIKDWDVYGKENNCDEKICLDYYYWNVWLGLRVLKEQLQMLGVETYIAYCLKAMTKMGFCRDEIDENFNIVKNEIPVNIIEEIYSETLNDKSSTFIINGLPKVKELVEKNFSSEIAKKRPWVRYFARIIDYFIWLNILYYIWLLISPNTYFLLGRSFGGTILRMIEYSSWILIEGLLLSKTGYTLGKLIFNIKVTDINGEKLTYFNALKRAFRVLLFGVAVGIPYAMAVANIISFASLMKNGETKWDREGRISVSHGKISKLRVIIAIFVLVVIPFVITYLRLHRVIL